MVESDQQLFLLKMTKARLALNALATFNSLQTGSAFEIINGYSFYLLCSPTFFYKDFYFGRGGEGQWTNHLDCFFLSSFRLYRNEALQKRGFLETCHWFPNFYSCKLISHGNWSIRRLKIKALIPLRSSCICPVVWWSVTRLRSGTQMSGKFWRFFILSWATLDNIH